MPIDARILRGRTWLITAAILCLGLLGAIARAGIATAGKLEPVYNGTDPWEVAGDLTVGPRDTGTLTIEAGSAVNVAQNTWVGSYRTASGVIEFAGGTLNTAGLVASPGEILGTGTINTATLVSDINLVFDAVDGLQQQMVFNSLPGQHVTVNIDASNPANTGALGGGYRGVGTLTIADGLSVSSGEGYLGYHTGADGTATVTGTGSQWNNSGRLIVGRRGEGTGTLIIEAGGVVSNADGYIGYSSAIIFPPHASNPAKPGWLGAGYRGVDTLTIANGLAVSSAGEYLGYHAGADGTATVKGAGSQWNNSGGLYVGHNSTGTLTIEGGGVVSSNRGYIGDKPYSNGAVTVRGAGSQWINSSILFVGQNGTGTLTIESGSVVSSDKGTLGHYDSATGTVTVTGDGSRWINSGDLSVGRTGTGSLTIAAGGLVSNEEGYIGYSHSSNSMVTVTGAGSQWNVSGSLEVANWSADTLTIAAGGVVNVTRSTSVGRGTTGSGVINFAGGTLNTAGLLASPGELLGIGTINTATLVSDVNLVFDAVNGLQQQMVLNSLPGQNITVNVDASNPANEGALGAGYRGVGTLTVADGLAVSSVGAFVGYHTGADGMATVTGAGSQWNNSGIMFVGHRGAGTLTVEAGGVVNSDRGAIGKRSGSIGTATVTGAGSQWNNSGSLSVGDAGTGTLTIAAGGVVSNANTSLGDNSGYNGTVTVTGVGSQWNNSGILFVGNDGTGTLTIENGGLASVAGTLTIDDNADGDSFINMASGGMLGLLGDADDSLASFLALVEGTDAIRYWDDAVFDWTDITGATYGVDYALTYRAEGDLAGYTVLTVMAVPEPTTLMLLGLGGLMLRRRRAK